MRQARLLFLTWFVSVAAASVGLAAAPASGIAPPPRLVVPGKVVNVVDGDTVDVRVSLVIRVRLLAGDEGCWAPESHSQSSIRDETERAAEKASGLESKAALEGLSLNKDCLLDLALRSDRMIDHLTLERMLANVYVDGRNVGLAQVRAGHASTTKGGRLGH